MRYFVYGEVTLKQQEWVKTYLSEINGFIEKHQGKVLSRSINMEKVEGKRSLPTNVILVEFPNRECITNFFNDPEYQPIRQLRLSGAFNEFTLFPAEDLALQVTSTS